MKFLLSSVIGLLVVASAMAIDKEEAKEMFKGMAQECKESTKASDDDVNLMADGKYPKTQEGKCLAACLFEQFGVVKDGKFDPENAGNLVRMGLGEDEEKIKKADEIIAACKDITHADKCEMAIMLGNCFEKEAEARGIKME